MLISTEHVTLTHDCLGLRGWILELCSHYLPIHKIHCAFPFAERTFILKLLIPVINCVPSWCFSSKMGRTSNIYFTVYSHKTAEVGCLWLYTVKYIFEWTFIAWLLQNWSLQSAGYIMSFVVCHPFSLSLSGWQKHETLSTYFRFFIWYCHVTAGSLITLSSTCVSDNLLFKLLCMIQVTIYYSRCWKWPPTTLRHTWYLVNRLTAVFKVLA